MTASARVLGAGASAALSACERAVGPGQSFRPNFVVILTDDLGYGDLRCYGSATISTPRLDRMAAEGVRLTDSYVPSPVCTQSRFALLTGRYSIRAGLDHVLFPGEHNGMPDREITLAGALKPLGYRSACIGKWHLGSHSPFLPTRHGFDYFWGLPHSNDMAPLPLIRGEETIDSRPDQSTLTQRYTEEAIAFLQRAKGGPFLLYLAHTMPHVPLHVSPQFRGRSAAGLYGDVVQEIDWSTSRVLDTLAELGLDERTLVIFTSDNGPWLEKGENGGSAGALRGGKRTVYEGGIRVPFLARWPGRLAPGLTIREPVSSLDLFPTLVMLAGGRLPSDRVIDGRFAWPTWSGRDVSPHQALYFYVVGELPLGLRLGRWKMHLAGTAPRLYDLRADAGETRDLSSQEPHVVRQLAESAERWRQLVAEQKAQERGL
ncbi:MAG: sulfatase [Gemmatimonadetes bacterium]|nr:sulfatase [Gemmatimonadota bacterium]